jgi:ribose transport system permease protein
MTTDANSARPASALLRLRYRYVPDHLIGELLTKAWIDTAIPATLLILVLLGLFLLTPGFFKPGNVADLSRVFGEYALVAIGEAIVMIAGGIDLSIGSVLGLCNFLTLALVFHFKLQALLALPITLGVGALIGSLNGVLIGYLRLRAFLTTLVTLIIVRAVNDLLGLIYSSGLVSDYAINGSRYFDFAGDGSLLGIPSSLIAAAVIATLAHIFLSRTRLGWHILAVGGSRRSAFNAGIRVRRTVFLTYVMSGTLTALAAYFYAARLNSAALSTGVGLELIIISGTVLGGISLGGGRGSIMKALLGTMIVLCISNGMLSMGLPVGGNSLVLGSLLLFAVILDIRWTKNRLKVLNRAYVSPTLVEQPPRPSIAPGCGSVYARVDSLGGARAIGLGVLDGPEDMVLDDEDNLFAGTRRGDIYRFFAPDYQRYEIFAHTGGRPLGLQVDRDRSIVVCVAGMGLYRLTKDRQVIALSVETKRGFSIVDKSKVRMADDLDIAPDGKIYYTDPTVRYEASEWLTDALEGRGNGRLLCYDPSNNSTSTVATNLVFANGVCLANDRQSVFVAETWGSRIVRYWIAGRKKGQLEPFIPNLPGYPDNINRASDGNYWVALVGMRSPAFDLALTMPGFRKRMIRRVAPDNWLFPNTNTGCLVKFDATGKILLTMWDPPTGAHPQITSVREHKGKLYLGGINNDRIGVFDLPGADPTWTAFRSYWGRPE